MLHERGRHCEARIEQEHGVFVVYLDVWFVDRDGQPTRVEQKRISEHRTRRLAEIAGHWIERTARKEID